MYLDKVCMVGLGYAGFPIAVTFALKSFNVIRIDVDRSKVDARNSDRRYIRKPGLDSFEESYGIEAVEVVLSLLQF